MSRFSALAASAATAFVLAACGGGGGDSPPTVQTPPAPPPVTQTPPAPETVFEAGTFEPSSTFRNICTPSGEKQFLRSFTNETYLWYDEVEDRDPTVETESVQDYFDELKTFRTTDSGKPVDEFHFSQTQEEFEARSAGVTFGYPFRFALLRASPFDADGNAVGRDLRVLYTIADGAAERAGLVRGSEIVTIDGVDVRFSSSDSDIDTLNAGLFPDVEGEEHTFGFIAPGSDEVQEVTLAAGGFQFDDILGTAVLGEGDSRTAYVNLRTFGTDSAERSLYDTLTELTERGDVDDLILDLRYNGGGFVAVACQLAYMIAGADDTTGRTCTQTVTNDKLPDQDPFPFIDETVDVRSGDTQFIQPGLPLPQLDVDEITVLTTADTCSASELVMNALNGIDFDISQVGTTTCGKPFGFRAEQNCGQVYFTVQFQSVNNKGFGDYADGFTPFEAATNGQDVFKGCLIEDDLSFSFGNPADPLTAAALQFQADGTCPSDVTAQFGKVASAGGGGRFARPEITSASLGIIDPRPGALGQEPGIILRRLIEAGLIEGL